MAYELTFVQGSPGRSYGESASPNGSGTMSTSNPITIKFADDDPLLNQVNDTDATPATLLEAFSLTVGSNTYTYPAGTQVALSRPARIDLKINGVNTTVRMQGLLVKVNGAWQPILPASASNAYPGLYIFTDNATGAVITMPPSFTANSSALTTKVNISYFGQPDPVDVECFTPGTLIDTPSGPRRVEDLLPGDRVLTRDHGAQPLLWVGRRQLGADQTAAAPRLRPIRIAAGALGPGMPDRDLVVSPQHRLLLRSRILSRVTGEAEVLTAACQLLGWPGVEVLPAETGVTYLHLACARHEIIRANGAWTETLYAGPQFREARSPMAREIALLFPALMAPDAPVPEPARPLLRGKPVREVARRAARNRRDLVEADA